MLKRLAILLSVVTLPLLFLGAIPAQAVGTGNPVVVSPTGTVAYGSPATVTVNFANAPIGGYTVTLTNRDPDGSYGYGASAGLSYSGEGDSQQSVSLGGAALREGRYDVEVSNEEGNEVFAAFTVAPKPLPKLSFSSMSVSPSSFYPTVRDGYRDEATVRFRLNREARVYARVVRPNGSVVRTVNLGTTKGRSWAWNGRKGNGAMAAKGSYSIKISAATSEAPAGSISRKRQVGLKKGYRTERDSAERTGYDTSSTKHSSSCYVDRWSYDQTTELDCWGGSYAKATYGFKVPSSAYGISFHVSGTNGGCCSGGSVKKTGDRASSTSYRVTVKVNDWRSYFVENVRIAYSYKVKI